ncbi:geranylgeranylglycerol-phosphate geranylgeranyltransferase [Flavobacteriaceae bacterium]|jgi:4-hydroxybenzoate polyprenyltransferase|nr:geranylgeranylglycerol-phosphate geranylgeranyltransferase [Flavobacteriaceae bacterium]MDB4306600.1 geranylgeranylglycerol-phosphate geranylgeranyltransferase [Flavobacteriaceae bacterium]
MLFNKKHQKNLLRLVSLFSVIRGYNIIVLVAALYLTARYILAPDLRWMDLLLDGSFFCLVLASALTSASGYIINNFFDAAKDQINRPRKFLLEHLVSQQSQLVLYLLLNMAVLFFASVISFKAVLLFSLYIFSIWLYSSYIKRWFWLSNLFSVLLTILPFWIITFYFKNFEVDIFYHALYLFLLLLIRDIVKDLENLKGDMIQQYQTLPSVFSAKLTKWIITTIIASCLIPIYLLHHSSAGGMQLYFDLSLPFLALLLVLLWRANGQKMYLWLHNLLKFWILVGVLCIAFMYKHGF